MSIRIEKDLISSDISIRSEFRQFWRILRQEFTAKGFPAEYFFLDKKIE